MEAQQPISQHVLAIASGKGGVGKSTIAVNLAITLAHTGASVGLLDADIHGPNIPRMMGIRGQPQRGPDGSMLPLEQYGVKLMSVGFLATGSKPVIWRGPLIGKLIKQFLTQVAWGPLDYLVVDLPPGTGDAQLTLCQSVPLTGGIIVSTPQDVALEDALRGLEMFRTMQVPILGLVENMSYFLCPHCNVRTDIFDHGGAQRAAAEYQVPFLGAMPLDPRIRHGGDCGQPIVVAEPESAHAASFRAMVTQLLAQIAIDPTAQRTRALVIDQA
ncbi:MAG: Mrp/NBP35 family ATP-binding protein [Candidatus Tectomicrobia bacterium]|uniref:Iron-sulfur cluster carrier protein n=1 Tax=Tectimicrobiota bacterium TaxID=2528274 RepID=A0A938B797_UNCTE|nr:Mrp/NBP35 family ATP-binding protein [Candidatus Tectomicrobia bacterium]